jgi:hypothetical protein
VAGYRLYVDFCAHQYQNALWLLSTSSPLYSLDGAVEMKSTPFALAVLLVMLATGTVLAANAIDAALVGTSM